MKSFLLENWAWITVPMLLVAALVAAALLTTTGAVGPFVYNVY